MSEVNDYVIRENPTRRMDNAELRSSIQNIMNTEGMKPAAAMCVSDTSSSYLPSVEISNADAKVIKEKKLAELKKDAPSSFDFDGGVRGLVDRADTNNDNRLSREEIENRLGGKLSINEARALKDIYQNFSAMDWDGNGRVSRADIEGRVRSERRVQENQDHLEQFQQAMARNRKLIDRNHDGRITPSEIRVAGQANSPVSAEDRRTFGWAARNL